MSVTPSPKRTPPPVASRRASVSSQKSTTITPNNSSRQSTFSPRAATPGIMGNMDTHSNLSSSEKLVINVSSEDGKSYMKQQSGKGLEIPAEIVKTCVKDNTITVKLTDDKIYFFDREGNEHRTTLKIKRSSTSTTPARSRASSINSNVTPQSLSPPPLPVPGLDDDSATRITPTRNHSQLSTDSDEEELSPGFPRQQKTTIREDRSGSNSSTPGSDTSLGSNASSKQRERKVTFNSPQENDPPHRSITRSRRASLTSTEVAGITIVPPTPKPKQHTVVNILAEQPSGTISPNTISGRQANIDGNDSPHTVVTITPSASRRSSASTSRSGSASRQDSSKRKPFNSTQVQRELMSILPKITLTSGENLDYVFPQKMNEDIKQANVLFFTFAGKNVVKVDELKELLQLDEKYSLSAIARIDSNGKRTGFITYKLTKVAD